MGDRKIITAPEPAALDYVSCPLCGSSRQEILYRKRRIGGSLGEQSVNVAQCRSCGFLFNSPPPDTVALSTYYAQDSMNSGQVFRDESATGHYPQLQAQRATYLARLLRQPRVGRLLDVGCGKGGFLRAVADELPDWELAGLDPSTNAVNSCQSQGLQVQLGALGDDILNAQPFDVITLISVLEHLPDPVTALGWCRRRLTADGILFIEVPDSLQPELSLTGFFNLEHIVHFTPGSLGRILREQGFTYGLRDRDADGVIRLCASNDFVVWQATPDPAPSDDRAQARQSVLNYAKAEHRLIDDLRRRVTEALEDWRQRGLRVAVYGAGIHTAQLATLVNLSSNACCILDGDPNKQGQVYLGLPVLTPQKLDDGDIDAVLISSNRFIDEIKRTVLEWGGDKVELRTCYE